MSLAQLVETLPSYAKDLRLNVNALLRDTTLTPQQAWGTWLATAIASRQPDLLRAVEAEAAQHLSEEALQAARGAAAIMGMNNIYYRFTHLASDKEYAAMPARLRMQIIGRPGVEKLDFELWSLAVSAIHGCGACIDSHERVLRQGGVSTQVVAQAVRIASVAHGLAVALTAATSETTAPAA